MVCNLSTPVLFSILNVFISLLENSAAASCDDYYELTKQPYFVDKSLLLFKYFIKETEAVMADKEKRDVANLNYYFVNCPRGFGKTTNLQMIRGFAEFEAGLNLTMKAYHSTKAHKVFSKLKIYNHKNIINKHMNRYGVIYLDLNCNPEDLVNETMIEKALIAKMGESFQTYRWLRNHRPNSRAMHTVRDVITGNISSVHIYRGLYYMAKFLDKYNPKGIILLVDNFDSAARIFVGQANLAVKYYYKLVYNMIDKLLSINLPSGGDFQKRCLCLITGVTSLYFESMEFKNHGYFRSAPFLLYGFLSPFFGFVQEDVDGLLAKYNCTEFEKTGIASMYKGYMADNSELSLYCPISVIEHLKSKQTFGVGKFESYWAANESIDFIVEFAKAPFFRAKLKELCLHNSFKVMSPMSNIDRNMFISFLESSSRNYEDMLDEDVPALLYYFFEHGFLKHATKYVWSAFTFANFEVKNELKKKLEERGLKFTK